MQVLYLCLYLIYKKTSMDLNKKHLLYLIVFFLFGNLNAFGQSINISGRILSQGTQDAVEYANIVLFKQDSIFLQGTTSDSIGRFEFMNLSPKIMYCQYLVWVLSLKRYCYKILLKQ